MKKQRIRSYEPHKKTNSSLDRSNLPKFYNISPKNERKVQIETELSETDRPKISYFKTIAEKSLLSYTKETNKIFEELFGDYFQNNEEIRFAKFYNFNWLSKDNNISILKEVIEKDTYNLIRYESLRNLIKLCNDDQSILPFYIKLLNDPDPGMRHYAALALGKHDNRAEVAKEAGEALFNLLADEDKFVAFRAAWAITLLPITDKALIDKILDTIPDMLIKKRHDKILASYVGLMALKIMSMGPIDLGGPIHTKIIKSISGLNIDGHSPVIGIKEGITKKHFKERLGVVSDLAERTSTRVLIEKTIGTGKYRKDGKLGTGWLDWIKEIEGEEAISLVYALNLKKLANRWKYIHDVVDKYRVLRITEEVLDQQLEHYIRGSFLLSNDKEILSQGKLTKELEDMIVVNREQEEKLSDEFLSGIDSLLERTLYLALKDRGDFIRYRAAGILYRIIKISNVDTGSEVQTAQLLMIRANLEEAYVRERVSSVKRKIKESLDLCYYSLNGLNVIDGYHNI